MGRASDELLTVFALAGLGYFTYQQYFPGQSLEQVVQNVDRILRNFVQSLPDLPPLPTFPQQSFAQPQGQAFQPGMGTGNIGSYSVVGVVGDFDKNSKAERTVEVMKEKGVQLIVGLGDYSYSGGASSWFDSIIGPQYQGRMKGALGNHDNDSYLEAFGQQSWTMPYSIQRGNLAVVFIDSDSPTNESEAEKAIMAAKAQHRTVFAAMHHPIVAGSGAHHPSDEKKIGKWFVPLAQKYGIITVFSGHNHLYHRINRNGIQWITVGTGGRKFYNSKPTSGTQKLINGTNGFVRIMVGPQSIGQFINHSGQVMDTFPIQ